MNVTSTCRGVLFLTGVLLNVDRAAVSALLRKPSSVPAAAFNGGLTDDPPLLALALGTRASGFIALGGGNTPGARARAGSPALATTPSSELESSLWRTGGA